MKINIIFFLFFFIFQNQLNSQSPTPFDVYDFQNDFEYISIIKKFKKEKKDLEDYQYLSDLSDQKKDYRRAIEFTEKRLELGENSYENHYRIGGYSGIIAKQLNSMSAIKYVKKAISHFEKALELNKNHVLSMISLSKLYAQLPMFLGGSFKKSEYYANRVMINDSIEGNLTKGLIEEVKGRKKISKIHYTKAIRLFNRKYNCEKFIEYKNRLRKNLYYDLIEIAILHDIFFDDSSCFLENVLKYNLSNVIPKEWIYFRLAQIHYKLNDVLKSEYYLNESLSLNPNFNEAKKLLNRNLK